MGIDVNLYVEADPNPERLIAAEQYFVARSTLGDPFDGHVLVAVAVNDWVARPRVEVNTMSRYYGRGYERGPWPSIYGAIRVLQVAFPGCAVFYGGDSSDDGQECTDAFLSGIWDHFLSPQGDDYYGRKTAGR